MSNAVFILGRNRSTETQREMFSITLEKPLHFLTKLCVFVKANKDSAFGFFLLNISATENFRERNLSSNFLAAFTFSKILADLLSYPKRYFFVGHQKQKAFHFPML